MKPKRRKSLDDTLLSPLSLLLTTSALNPTLVKENSIHNETKASNENIGKDIYAMLPFQQETKKRLKDAMKNTSISRNTLSLRQNVSSLNSKQPKEVLQRTYSDNKSGKKQKRGETSQVHLRRRSEPDFLFTKDNHTGELDASDTSLQDISKYLDALTLGTKKENTERKFYKNQCNRSVSLGNFLEPSNVEIFKHARNRSNSVQKNTLCKQSPLLLQSTNEKFRKDVQIKQRTPKIKKKIFKPFGSIIKKDKILDNAWLYNLIKSIIDEKAKDMKYDHLLSKERCHMLSKSLEDTIKGKLLSEFKEYKIVVLTFIGEIRDQGIDFATQFTFTDDDVYAIAAIEKENMYIWVAAFAILLDNDQSDVKL